MNVEHPLAPVEGHDHPRNLPASPMANAEAAEEITPLDRVLAVMRGRWPLAIVLGGVLGILGGVAGWLAVTPKYESTGMIHVVPVLPRGVELEDHTLPMYSSWVNSQATLIQSQANLASALQRNEWRPLIEEGRAIPSLRTLMQNVTVQHPRNSEHIEVAYTHPDPVVAQRAVQTIIAAYEVRHEGTQLNDNRLNVLEQRRTNLQAEQQSLRDARRRIGDRFGTDDLSAIYSAKITQANRLEARLAEVEMALATVATGDEEEGAQGDAAVPNLEDVGDELAADFDAEFPEDDDQPGADLTLNDIAAMDQQTRRYIEQRQSLDRELRRLTLSLGDNHREVKQARSLRDSISETLESHVADLRSRYTGSDFGLNGEASISDMERQREMLTEAYSAALTEAVEIGRRNMEISGIRDTEEQVSEDLRRTNQRIEDFLAEARVGGRINVQSRGEEPLGPARDRRKLAAVAGFTFGSGTGFAMILGLAFLDRRFRSIQDASDALGRITMLGILPRLPDDLADPEQASIASHCVHQIRTLLQIGPESTSRRVFSVTSPGVGNGKTSLTLALGLSFARAGAKTLLIDFDLGSGGLTERVNAIIRRKIGQILQRQHLVTEQQVEQALRVAQESNRRLGEVLVELGYVTSEDLEDALSLQDNTPVGLLDALAGEPVEHCVAETGIADLSILPLGAAEPDDVARLSPLTIRRLLEEARQQFDIILVDTGPVPASLDASHVAVESDGVVMVVSRGEQRTQAERSLDYLVSIDARFAGVVFNRAEQSDLEAIGDRSGAGEGSLSRRRSSRFTVQPDKAHSRFGPVARAVAGSASHSKNGTNGTGEGGMN